MNARHVRPSTLHCQCHAGYVAWVYENHKYKNSIMKNLSSKNIKGFIRLFNVNKCIAIYILTKRLFKLLQLPCDLILKYDTKDLCKVNMLLEFMSVDLLIAFLPRCNLERITKHNIRDVIRYYNDYQQIMNTTSQWGPGNHSNIDENITQHYIKHVLSDEGRYWESLLSDMSEESYKDYAQNMFKRMERVVIHSNGRQTYMSGFYGKVFIVGRYNEGVFGISSCYYVNNGEKPGRYIDTCINIHD